MPDKEKRNKRLSKVLSFPKSNPAGDPQRESLIRHILKAEEREFAHLQELIAEHRAILAEEFGDSTPKAVQAASGEPKLISPTFARFQAERAQGKPHAS